MRGWGLGTRLAMLLQVLRSSGFRSGWPLWEHLILHHYINIGQIDLCAFLNVKVRKMVSCDQWHSQVIGIGWVPAVHQPISLRLTHSSHEIA